jgi:aspartyl/glutamyl-tRNA(Asn/Gln) amidotransferase C subunit
MKSSDVKHLAELAYISVPEEQQESFEQDFSSILQHIDTLTQVTEEIDVLPQYYHETLRQDICLAPHPRFSQNVREKILEAMPATDGTSLVVKTVLKK